MPTQTSPYPPCCMATNELSYFYNSPRLRRANLDEIQKSMRATLGLAMMILLMLGACTSEKKATQAQDPRAEVQPQAAKEMQSYISIFEIPVTDISRAIGFYEKVLDLKIEKVEMPGMEMGILPYENQMVTVVLVKGEGYEPTDKGATVYLDAGDDLQLVLDQIEAIGGKVLVPKSPHADGGRFFALFLDTEGNRLGLDSPHQVKQTQYKEEVNRQKFPPIDLFFIIQDNLRISKLSLPRKRFFCQIKAEIPST